MSLPPSITLFTADNSVYGQRANIVLEHLQFPFKEVRISLDKPREQWFLEMNSYGKVPVLEIVDNATGKKQVIIESALIVHFLLDLARGLGEDIAARAEGIYPQGRDLASATQRYEQGLFLETHFQTIRAAGRALQHKRDEASQEAFVTAAKSIDSACPEPGFYFGDSKTFTLVEVLTGPWMMRAESGFRWGLLPNASFIEEKLQNAAPRFYAWMKKVSADEAIKAGTWDEESQRHYSTNALIKAGIQV